MYVLTLIVGVVLIVWMSKRLDITGKSKEAHATDLQPHDGQFAQIELLTKLLQQQIETADLYISYMRGNKTLEAVRLDPFPEDDFSIGYIAGFGDACMQSQALSNEGTDTALLLILFMSFYGREHGTKNFKKFLHLSENQVATMLSGMNAGGQEYNQFVCALGKNEEALPCLLGEHLLELYKAEMGDHWTVLQGR